MEIEIQKIKNEDYQTLRLIDEDEQSRYLGSRWGSLSLFEKEQHLVIKQATFPAFIRGGYSFTAIVGKKIVGFIVAYLRPPTNKELFVEYICIKTGYQKQGIATSLYQAIIREAKRFGVEKVTALINSDNISAISLHRSLGFILQNRIEASLQTS